MLMLNFTKTRTCWILQGQVTNTQNRFNSLWNMQVIIRRQTVKVNSPYQNMKKVYINIYPMLLRYNSNKKINKIINNDTYNFQKLDFSFIENYSLQF